MNLKVESIGWSDGLERDGVKTGSFSLVGIGTKPLPLGHILLMWHSLIHSQLKRGECCDPQVEILAFYWVGHQ